MPDSRRIVRWLGRLAAALGVLLVVALAVAVAFSRTDRFRALASARAVAFLNETLRGEVALERIEGSVWGDLALVGLSVRFEGREILRVPRVELRYALLPILRGRIDVAAIEADGARATLVQEADGGWNLLRALSSKVEATSEGRGGIAVDLASLVVRDAAIEVTPAGEPTLFVTDASLDAGLRLRPDGAADADVRTLACRAVREGLPPLAVETTALTYRGAKPPATLAVRRLALRTERSSATLTGSARHVDVVRDVEVDATLDVATLAPEDVVVFLPQWSLAEPASGRVRVAGRSADLHAVAALTAGDAAVRARARLDVAREVPRYAIKASAERVDLAAIVGGFGVAGTVGGAVRGRGIGTDLGAARAAARVEVAGLATRGWQLGDVATRLRLVDGRATFTTDATIDGARRARADGDVEVGGAERYRVALALDHFNPKLVAPGRAPLGGDVNLDATLEGRGFEPAAAQARARLTLAPSKLGDVRLTRGGIDVTVADGRATIAEATVVATDTTLTVRGDLGLEAPARGALQYDLAVGDLRPWLALAGEDGTGTLGVHGTARGAVGDLALDARLQAAGVRVGTSSLGRADVTVAASALGQAEPRGQLSLALERVDAGVTLRTLAATATAAEGRRLSADVRAVDGAGRTHHAAADGRYGPAGVDARVTDLTLEAPPGTWSLRHPVPVVQRDGQLSIANLVLASGERQVTVDGTLARTGRQALRLDVDRFPLEVLQPLVAGAPDLRGVLAASARVGGTAAAPELDAKASIAALVIAGQPYDGFAATARYASGSASAQAEFRQDAAHALSAKATVPLALRWDPAWQARASGDASVAVRSSGLSLAALNAVAGRSLRNIGGEVVVDLTATGPVGALRPRGHLELRDGTLLVPATGTDVREAAVQVDFDPSAVRVGRIFARAGDGTIEGGGTIPLGGQGASPLQLTLDATRFRVAASSRYRADIDGRLAVAGTTASPAVSGRIEVRDALIRPDLAFLGKAPPPRDDTIEIVGAGAVAPAAEEAPPPAPALYRDASLDLVLAVHRGSWVRHEDAAVELEGEVHATKRPGEDPVLVGEIHTVRGWATLQGRRFAISRGRVEFTGGHPIDPTLDVVADYKRGEYLVHAIVSGTASAPALTLESEPSLSQADILSVLVFGKPAKDLSEGEKTDLQRQAAQMAGGFAFAAVGQSVANALGLEEHGILVEEMSTERVALGSYLTEKTYVTIGQDIGQRQGQELAVQYQLLPRLSVETTSSTIGGSGLNLIWHRRY